MHNGAAPDFNAQYTMGAARGCFVNLTKLHLSMSKSWLTPDYLFFDKMLTLASL